MLVEDVWALCADQGAGGEAAGALGKGIPTPQAEASGPPKRPRLCHAADIAFPHQQQQQQHPAVLTPALTGSQPALPSPAEACGGAQAELGSLPWRPDHLLAGARRYLANLTAMHGQCVQLQAETKAAEMAVAIFRRVYCARPAAQRAELLAAGPCQGLAQESVLAAALWLAIKFEGSRSAMPSAPIMYHMTGVPPGLLMQQEMAILEDLQWNLVPAAQEAGAVGAADAWAGEDQQRQLAELARPAPAPTRRTRPHALPPADQRSAFLATVMTAQLEALPPAAAQTLLAAGNRLEPAAAEPADLASAMSLPPPCDLPGPDDSSDALARLIRGL